MPSSNFTLLVYSLGLLFCHVMSTIMPPVMGQLLEKEHKHRGEHSLITTITSNSKSRAGKILQQRNLKSPRPSPKSKRQPVVTAVPIPPTTPTQFPTSILPTAHPTLKPTRRPRTAQPTLRPTRAMTARPTKRQNPSMVQATVGSSGGVVTLPQIASVSFAAGSFVSSTNVTVFTTPSITNSPLRSQFVEFTVMFRPSNQTQYFVQIQLDGSAPLTASVALTLNVPATLASLVSSTMGVEVFARFQQDSYLENPFYIFELLDDSVYDATAKSITIDLPTAAFTTTATSNGHLLAVIILALTPGGNSKRIGSNTAMGSGCEAASIRCPVEGGCVVSSPFDRVGRKNPVTGNVQPHLGVDYKVTSGTPILSASAGKVERSYRSTTYGETVIVRHTDGSATLYAHLQSRDVKVGDTVALQQRLGPSDSTGQSTGPHLHFEYVPNGQIIQSKNRIDPDACVGITTSGSITAGDNNLPDDSFELSVDGIVIGVTTIGGSNTLSINNIIPGTHVLALKVVIAPDNVGTYFVQLSDGLVFDDGTTYWSDVAPEGAVVSRSITVPP